MTNPHFDDGIVVWDDIYSGHYHPPSRGYSEQFELQWKIALENEPDYCRHPGVATDEDFIADRIYEWTGECSERGFKYDFCGVRKLDHPVRREWIQGKDCVDIACGMGRWTKAMQILGAKVTSFDMSKSAVKSVSRFNPDSFTADLMEIDSEHPEWIGRYDFANFWGVAMHTHDPQKAFTKAASLVKPGGRIFMMVYSPEGMHASPLVIAQRKIFYRLKTVEERLKFVDCVFQRRWHSGYSLIDNLKNLRRNLLKLPKGGKAGVLDMLEPLYNWVIPLDIIYGWMEKNGFQKVKLLNEFENPRCAYHVMGRKNENG